jgi:8-oxo-dGTP diphosphatase
MNNTGRVSFCIQCGTPMQLEEKFGRIRPVCPACGWIYFTDPKVAVAVVVIHENRVLLTRRINPPFQGYWSLPAGFMDADETTQEAGERECREETGLSIRITKLLDVFNGREHPHGADIVLTYLGELTGGVLQAGDDADQAEFFPLDLLPPLAFNTTRVTLEKLNILSNTSDN